MKEPFIVKRYVPDEELESVLNTLHRDGYLPVKMYRNNKVESTTIVATSLDKRWLRQQKES